MNKELQFESNHSQNEWFRQESLGLLTQQLRSIQYPGYPSMESRLWCEDYFEAMEPLVLPMGPWETSEGETPTILERQNFANRRLRLDAWGRPLHPWFEDMLSADGIGVVTGKGAYWNWGPNYTADSIVLRHDKAEPHVLLIKRSDTGQWALPGGFINTREESLIAALRETNEETGLDLSGCNPVVTQVYCGPLADVRITANAWPETTAFRFDLLDMTGIGDIQGADDATTAAWVPVSKIDQQMFGSHRLLIQLALQGSR